MGVGQVQIEAPNVWSEAPDLWMKSVPVHNLVWTLSE